MLETRDHSYQKQTWRNLKCILQREENQSGKAAYQMIPAIRHSGKSETMEMVKKIKRKISDCQRPSGQSGAKDVQAKYQRCFIAMKLLSILYKG